MLNIARRCVPFTPFDKDLSTATVTLVSATGVYLPDQQPFPTEDPGDVSYRIIAGETEASKLRIAHHHYDHSEADADPNIIFLIDRLRELVAEGFIAAVNDKHYSYGFTTRLKELYETTFPEIADKIERSKTKLVLLTAGCPETCHRTISNLAREIESRGVPTLIISASPGATESVRPPRAMTFDGSEIGRIIGRAGDRESHKKVLRRRWRCSRMTRRPVKSSSSKSVEEVVCPGRPAAPSPRRWLQVLPRLVEDRRLACPDRRGRLSSNLSLTL